MSCLNLIALFSSVLPLTVKCFALPDVGVFGKYSNDLSQDQALLPFGQNHRISWRPSDGLPKGKHTDRSLYDPGDDKIPLSEFLVDHRSDGVVLGNANGETASADGGVLVDGELLKQLRVHIKEDEDIAVKSALLLKLLENYESDEPMPVVYVEEPDADTPIGELDDNDEYGEIRAQADKRSGRYSHRYPYKRQNQRNRPYEPDQRYLCVPSRNDVLKLLIGLDEGRKGNHGRTVNFCNRKRPAKAIFSNIRFLG